VNVLIDVCIVTYCNEATIADTLASIETKIGAVAVVVSVWDNSPDMKTVNAIDRFQGGASRLDIVVYHDGQNLGFGRSCNQLAQSSKADWLLFLNPDAKIHQWPSEKFPTQVEFLVGAAVYFPDGSLQQTFGDDRAVLTELSARLLRRRKKVILGQTAFGADFVSGAAFVASRSRYLASGGFDADRYFMYYEDIDLGRRWRLAGGTVVVDPSWQVVHYGGFSAKQNQALALVRSFESARAYHKRWSAGARLFRMVCIVECLGKLTLGVTTGHVGSTDVKTQWRLFKYLVSGKSPKDPIPRKLD